MIKRRRLLFGAGTVLFLLIISSAMIAADDRKPKPPGYNHPPVGIYIQMTEDFYRALKEDSQGGSRTISTNMSEEYLHQIAIATRYTVETNLQVLQQQERIIQLLEALQNKPGAVKP